MIIAANWKAYVEDIERAKKLVATAKRLARNGTHQIILAPPSVLLGLLATGNRSAVAFSAQDISRTTGGAQTGENTAQAFVVAGATHAIIGHSERRAMGDTNAIVSEKLAHALAQGLIPILCIGERERDEESRYLSFVREEIETAFAPLSSKERQRVMLAYEPIWAIGKTASEAMRPEELVEMVLYIRKVLTQFLPGKAATNISILYGGSVEPGNVRALAGESQVDGFLIGHASVEVHSFETLVKELA